MPRQDFSIHIFRAVAVFLLLLTATELTHADSWCEEKAPLASRLQFSAHPVSSPAQQTLDDRCFCCCGHVDFTAAYEFVVVASTMAAPKIAPQHTLIASIHPTYPPPRSA